jgi:hypothetical protein
MTCSAKTFRGSDTPAAILYCQRAICRRAPFALNGRAVCDLLRICLNGLEHIYHDRELHPTAVGVAELYLKYQVLPAILDIP